MLKQISGIKLAGANFGADTIFDFFNPIDGNKPKTIKGAIVYGRNGTGKSTIARAFRKLAGEDIDVVTSATLLDDGGNPVSLTEEEKKQIFIFDEDFIRNKVLLQEDHLDTIVMLGQAADLTKKIEEAEAEKKTAQDNLNHQEELLTLYKDKDNTVAPIHYVDLLQQALKGDDNWAGRDRKIHNQKNNTRVNEETYKKFVDLSPVKPKTELLLEFANKLEEFEAAKSGTTVIDQKVPSIPAMFFKYDDEAIQELLSLKIERPELTEREKKLFALVQEGKTQDLKQRLQVFQNKEIKECPYCYQTLTDDHKESLIKNIEKVLGKEVENHQNTLFKHVVESLDLDLSSYNKLEAFETCFGLNEEINSALQENNDNLKKKIDNPYQPIQTKASAVKELIERLDKSLRELERERINYNQKAGNISLITKELEQINNEIAYYDVADLAAQLEKQQGEYSSAQEKHKDLQNIFQAKKQMVEDLEAQRGNIHIAMDVMNACLKYIFFAEGRLKIEYIDGVYKLLSHGKSVKPSEVSVGERNIIGLCYFFTSILEGQEETKAYGKEYLLVIDDPVSSYDTENRIGILSFLKYKLSEFLEGNINTKALILTHDLMAFYDIDKVFEEIVNACKSKGDPEGTYFYRLELTDSGCLTPFSYNKRQEYTEMVKTIYCYACGGNGSEEQVIGNVMRQVLEAFSTFVYKKSIEKVSTDDQILNLLEEREYILYYKNLMYRLVLHGGSHREEQIKAMQDFRFFNLISESEKRRTARDVLCFIYLLNKTHLLEHLKECDNAEGDLNSWCQDIKSRSAID